MAEAINEYFSPVLIRELTLTVAYVKYQVAKTNYSRLLIKTT